MAKKCGKTQRLYKDWMKNTCSSQLNLSQISPFKVLDELYGLNCAKAVGHDGLPISYLVKAADFIYQPLTHIFNTSIASSIFPNEMKIAKVIPLFKSGDRCTTSNYRPISRGSDIMRWCDFAQLTSCHIRSHNQWKNRTIAQRGENRSVL